MTGNALTSRIKALIAFRALFITLLLGSAFLFKIEYLGSPQPKFISYFIIVLYLLTITYSLLMNRVKNLLLFGYIQLIIDVIAEIGRGAFGPVATPFAVTGKRLAKPSSDQRQRRYRQHR